MIGPAVGESTRGNGVRTCMTSEHENLRNWHRHVSRSTELFNEIFRVPKPTRVAGAISTGEKLRELKSIHVPGDWRVIEHGSSANRRHDAARARDR